MTSPYSPPTSSLHDDAVNKKRIIHSVSAAASSFIFLPAIILTIIYLLTKSLDIVDINIRFLILNAVCAVIAGLAVYPFRSLAWYWAMFVGPIIGFFGMIAFGTLIDALTAR